VIVRELLARFGFLVDSAPLDKVDRRINSTKASTDALKGAFKAAAAAVAGFVSVRAALDAVDKSIQFGSEMGKIQSLIPGNTKRTLELRDAVKALAVEYGRTTSDVGAGLYDVLSTFGDTQDAVALTAIAVKSGAAGAATTKDGLALLGAVTKAYGDTSAEAAQKVADLGFQTVNLGKVELPELAAVIGKTTPLAKALAVSQEELFASFATLTGVTGHGAEVATQMASIMRSLTDRTPQAAKAFKKAFAADGIKTAQQAIGKYGLIGVLRKLVAQTDGTAEGVQKLFGRAEAMTAALALTGAQADDFEDKLKAMRQAGGAADTAFRGMTTGLAGTAFQAQQTRAKVEQLQIQVGDELAPAVGDLQIALLEIAKVTAGNLIPMFDDIARGSDQTAAALEPVAVIARVVTAAVAGVAFAVDAAITTFRVWFETIKGIVTVLAQVAGASGMAVVAMQRLKEGDFEGAAAAATQARTYAAAAKNTVISTATADKDLALDFLRRGATYGRSYLDPEGLKAEAAARKEIDDLKAETAEIRKRRASDAGARFKPLAEGFRQGGLSGLFAQVGAVNVNVTTAPGTTAEQSVQVAKEGARQLWQQMLRQASRATPNPQDVPAWAGAE
jgi:TP901 family phage tail tape measure protein